MKNLCELANKVGFRPKTFSTRVAFDKFLNIGKVHLFKINRECEVVLLAEMQHWLREKHSEIVLVDTDLVKGMKESRRYLFNVDIKNVDKDTVTKCDRYDYGDDSGVDDYETALRIGLNYAFSKIQEGINNVMDGTDQMIALGR